MSSSYRQGFGYQGFAILVFHCRLFFVFVYLIIYFFTEFPAYSIILKQLSREIRARSLDTAYLRTKDSPLTGLPKIGRARACTLAVETCDLVSLRRIFERAKEGFLEAPIKAALAVRY